MKFLLTDLKRIFTEPAFFVSIIFNLLLLFGALIFYLTAGETDTLYTSSQALALPFVAPILAAMPYSVIIMQEKETRFGILMNLKLHRTGYQLSRFFTSGISGAAALFFPQLVLFVACICIGGVPDLDFAAQCLVLPLTFGFGYSVISYGLTFVNRQRYVPLVMPQVIYLLCIYAFPYLGLEQFYPPLDISPSIYGGEIIFQRFAVPVILTVTAFLLTLYGKAGDRRWQN